MSYCFCRSQSVISSSAAVKKTEHVSLNNNRFAVKINVENIEKKVHRRYFQLKVDRKKSSK
jgi:hypothetical protein